jgi:hypothetical protein
MAGDTKDATQLFDCIVNGAGTMVPGLNKIAGAPSYQGIPLFSMASWGTKALSKQLPELGPYLEKASPYLLWLSGANAVWTTKQCLAGSASKAMGLGGN